MNCHCGGITSERIATHRGTDLTYERCTACGRCGEWRLMRDGLLAYGVEARQRFSELRERTGSYETAEITA